MEVKTKNVVTNGDPVKPKNTIVMIKFKQLNLEFNPKEGGTKKGNPKEGGT
jgi:hypothetical protein